MPPFVPNQLEPISTYFPNSKPATNEDMITTQINEGAKPLGKFWPFANSPKLKDF